MSRETAEALSFGATVVAALLFFTAFVALFRHDLGDPLVAAATFAGPGVAVLIVRALVRQGART